MRRSPGQQLLIVAACGRALAESARRGGWSPIVIDGFADQDTRAAAARCLPAPGGSGGLNPERVCAQLRQVPRGIGIIYGGGLEAWPELVDDLTAHGRLYGNSSRILRSVQDPEFFFGLLRVHDIPHPDTCDRAPSGPAWLRKRVGACGGEHVWPAMAAPDSDASVYYQRYVEGQPMSALFLTDGHSARVIGFNRQWTAWEDPLAPFRYGGAASRARLSLLYAAMIEEWAGVLARELGLYGLNGVDFIATDKGPVVVELNPRPCATLELYDRDLGDGLIALHVHSCRHGLPRVIPWLQRRVRAHAMVYAQRSLRVPPGLDWPSWARDLPHAGQLIAAGQPVCSVHGEAGSVRSARAVVRERQVRVLDWLSQSRATA